MAKNTTLKTRIQNRHDTEANWTTASNATKPFIPLKGEVIVYDPDATNTTPRVKIGDGTTKVGDLAFVAGDISKYLTSSDLANYVTTNTDQTISGSKTFTNDIYIKGRDKKFVVVGGVTPTLKQTIELTIPQSKSDDASIIFNAEWQPPATGEEHYNKTLLVKPNLPSHETEGYNWTTETYTVKIPFADGTLALTSDIPDVSKYVTTDTAQTIGGSKTFSDAVTIGASSSNMQLANDAVMFTDAMGRTGTINHADFTEDTVKWVLPDKPGTIALTDDIPDPITNYVTTDTEQTISGVKTFTGDVQLNGVGILSKVGNAGSSYATILKGSGNVVEVGSTSYQTRIYSNGRISVYDYSTSPSTSEKIAYQSEIPTIPADNLTKSNFNTQMAEGFSLMQGNFGAVLTPNDGGSQIMKIVGDYTYSGADSMFIVTDDGNGAYVGVNPGYIDMKASTAMETCYISLSSSDSSNTTLIEPNSVKVSNPSSSSQAVEMTSSGFVYSRNVNNIKTTVRFNDAGSNIDINMPSSSGTLLTDADLSIAPTKVKDTFVSSSWSTSSATTDTQFGKYYKDVTIPNKNIINVRCVSTKGMSGITLDYAPEIKCNNRRTSDTNLRIYSNSQLEGAVIITLVGDTLPNKFSKTNATLSTSSWATSSATVDTQFAKYYTDITVPAGDVMNIRILSNEDVTGISIADYYPEVWSDNRKINSTTLRIYSNKQVAGSVTVLIMEV